jgi:hypothetical protein
MVSRLTSQVSLDWTTLRHAYGTAADIPALLAQAKRGPAPAGSNTEPWFMLWSSLCHQGDVYSASLAAVPELIAIAKVRTDRARTEALYLAASIECERHGPHAPPLPHDFAPLYYAAVRTGAELITSHLPSVANPDDRRMLEIAAAAFEGDLELARALFEADS